jgi:pyruvate/2-oxoglutarate dehydrogenase complex dihydrolipoamide dehydrogenase (E3) component
MEKLYSDIVVIGGGPGGAICSVTAKLSHPEKEVMNIREFENQMVPCAIPYTFSDILGSVEKNLISCAMADKIGMKTLVGRVEKVDLESKTIYLADKEVNFDKLVFATGSKTFVHPSLQHALKLKGVFSVPKNVQYIKEMIEYVKEKKRVVVVGTGFIGIEMAIELCRSGKEVTVVGSKEYILANSFDDEIAAQAHQEMLNAGVKYIAHDRVVDVTDNSGDGVVDMVKLKSGESIETEVVVLATGYKANTELAQGLGLSFGHYGGIMVDEYMKSSNPDVFAIGDCAMKRGFISKSESKTMLASTASAEGRVAGMNIYGIQNLKNFSGTIAIFSTMVAEVAFSSAGITEAEAKASNAAVVSAVFEGSNRHPETMPDAQKQVVKLVAMQNTGQIIGGQIIGGKETGEMINMIGIMIENKMSIYDAMTMQVSTQPHLTAAPPSYPVVMCASMIASKLKSMMKA